MSADLFAEFGSESVQAQEEQPPPPPRPGVQHADSFAFFDGWSSTSAPVPKSRRSPPVPDQPRSSLAQVVAASTDDNDDWGDFEGGTSFESAAAAKQDPFVSSAAQPSHDLWNISQPTERPPQSVQSSGQKAPIVKAKKSTDPSVLFDAEAEFDDEDDFGDFEGTETRNLPEPARDNTSSALADLLGDMSVAETFPASAGVVQTNNSGQVSEGPLFTAKATNAAFKAAPRKKQVIKTAAPVVENEDSWDTFDDWEASIPTKSATATSAIAATTFIPSTSSSTMPAPIFTSDAIDPQPGELPPTNVPPPGVLLSLFPSLFTEAQDKLFKPMAAQPLPMRNKLMAEPATIVYLQGYLMLSNVAAQIVAGRKLRWKRDQHLSQGMRIGPASSRATSGMKLAGIDKGENMKEERETADVVRAWKEQVGRLRHVVSGANQIKSGILGPVPDIQETMPVRTLKQSEGGIPARQPCMLCGLKREERVTAANLSTDDSFGEWWIEQVNMHRACRNFWNEHKDVLRQR
ncbi:hypothetical protein ACN47E_001702 [Coniothyrium glycines]